MPVRRPLDEPSEQFTPPTDNLSLTTQKRVLNNLQPRRAITENFLLIIGYASRISARTAILLLFG
jgi:hypothetical protein